MSERNLESAEAWALAAAGWERHRDVIAALGAPVTERLLELVEPRSGESFLEIACGNGEMGLAVAERLRAGRLIQTDLVPEMVEVARRETRRRGLTNVEHRTLDAEDLELPPASVDAVVCRWGYMLAPDPVRALRETARVLRPTGRVALSVWAERDRNPWGTMVGQALVQLGLGEPADPNAPGPFQLGERSRLLDAIHRAGLVTVVEDEVSVSWPPMTASDFWATALETSTTLRRLVQNLSSEQLDQVRELVQASLADHATEDGTVEVPGVCRVVLARRASRPAT